MFLRTVTTLALAVGTATAALGQDQGTIEAGAFGRYTIFDNSLGLADRPGFGARLGVFVLPNLQLEGTGSFTPTKPATAGGDVSYIPLHARLVYNLPASERLSVLLGAGFVHNEYGQDANASENGANGLLGLRYLLSDKASLRLEGLADYIPSPANAANQNWNWGVQLGVGFLLGGGPPPDADGDGVRDRDDRCPATATGETVDATGCALDGDRDGVSDMRDTCPNTPAGERVDARGCAVDTDGDGVRDSMDRCANTTRGTPVDANGCPRDADGDGVADAADRCPNTAQGVPVDANGCPRDSDGDGVPDANDRCPNTERGAEVSANGCAVDTDGDGVPNGIDRCPTTAPNTRVDPTGCAVLFTPEATTMVLEGVNFATGSATLTPESEAILNGVAETLKANMGFRVEVGGYTDNIGSRAGNVNLSQRRAESVRMFLIANGVAADRLVARGYGPDSPIADNATAEGRAKNRRVELRRIGN